MWMGHLSVWIALIKHWIYLDTKQIQKWPFFFFLQQPLLCENCIPLHCNVHLNSFELFSTTQGYAPVSIQPLSGNANRQARRKRRQRKAVRNQQARSAPRVLILTKARHWPGGMLSGMGAVALHEPANFTPCLDALMSECHRHALGSLLIGILLHRESRGRLYPSNDTSSRVPLIKKHAFTPKA